MKVIEPGMIVLVSEPTRRFWAVVLSVGERDHDMVYVRATELARGRGEHMVHRKNIIDVMQQRREAQ